MTADASDIDTSKEVCFPSPRPGGNHEFNPAQQSSQIPSTEPPTSPDTLVEPAAEKEVHLVPSTEKEWHNEGGTEKQVVPNSTTEKEVHYDTTPENYSPDAQYPIPVTSVATIGSQSPEAQEASSPPGSQRSGHHFWRRSWRFWVIVGLVTVLCIIAVVLGAVLGTRANQDNSSSSKPKATGTSPPYPIATPSSEDIKVGASFSASFTWYGTNDGGSNESCNTVVDMTCGFYSEPGYSAQVSENLYGAAPDQGSGIVCGTCWRLHADLSSSGMEMNETIIVIANNNCPAEYEVCRQKNLQDVNEYNATVHFNLCADSGAKDALIGTKGLAIGSATRVDCKEWNGVKQGNS